MKGLKEIATWKTIIFLFIIDSLFTFHVFKIKNEIYKLLGGKVVFLEEKFSYDYFDVLKQFKMLGNEGMYMYSKVFSGVYTIYPFIHGVLYFLLLVMLLKKLFPKNIQISYWIVIPVVIFHSLENFLLLNLLQSHLNISTIQVFISSLVTQLKWIGTMIMFLTTTVLFTLFLIRTYAKNREINFLRILEIKR
ncbi:conserved membrane protein of unknown function [Tenacibaculum sp. 190130A14a]|uniref:Uncharacterized protein n=1 Tax=Tenacibaculum polynesiense TaxID=3137857 RepID=A0ABP1F0E3_9FLAO